MRLALEEMYSPGIATQLRERGHDAISTFEREDLRAAIDTVVFERAQTERRTIVTNNVRDFAPLAVKSAASGLSHYGLVFTSDKSLPRSRDTIGEYVRRLDELMAANPADGALVDQVRWL